ncbi:MAG: hypothetical protein D6702_07955 [Planctomycetota bacterium]|nr:MAG: hypothetical protein D6702_07955 [Planctomycetota bacterium]
MKDFLLLSTLLLPVALLPACGGKDQPAPTPAEDEALTEVPTPAEAEAEAAQEINAENLNQALDQLEQEVGG